MKKKKSDKIIFSDFIQIYSLVFSSIQCLEIWSYNFLSHLEEELDSFDLILNWVLI